MNKNKTYTLTIEAKTWRERIRMAIEILRTGKVAHEIPADDLIKEGVIEK